VKFDAAAARISAEFVTPYPPGTPDVAPGELVVAQYRSTERRKHE
jgi:arginine/lysine/ornithine decarboxylase